MTLKFFQLHGILDVHELDMYVWGSEHEEKFGTRKTGILFLFLFNRSTFHVLASCPSVACKVEKLDPKKKYYSNPYFNYLNN